MRISTATSHYLLGQPKLRTLAFLLSLLWLAINPSLFAQSVQPVTVVDVLMLYTPQARVGAGGTATLLANIDLALLEANSVLQNSGANVRIRLAGTSEMAYTESGSVAIDLARLRNPDDPDLGQASKLRDQYAADLVCLVTETGYDYEFYGLQGPSKANAFSIIKRPYLTGAYDLPVALSFNFGCQLERPYADSVAAFPYAYGYSFSVSNILYSTVDAFSGQRLPFFSNPSIVYQGVAAGVPDGSSGAADNSLVLNHTAPIVAAFEGTAPVTLPPSVQILFPAGDTNSPLPLTLGTNLMLLAAAADTDGFVERVNFYSQNVATGALQFLGFATNAPFGINWTNLPVGNWRILAQAVDNLGASTRTDSGLTLQVTYPTPPNDDFANPTALSGTNISVSGTTVAASLEKGEPDWNNGAPSVWYAWTAPANGRLAVSISGMPYGTSFGAYTGSSVSNLTDFGDNAGYRGEFDFPVLAGITYSILVATPPDPFYPFDLNLEFQPQPANDNFENRARLQTGIVATADNFAATFQSSETDFQAFIGLSGMERTLWWTWTAPADGEFTLSSTCDFAALLGVFQGNALTNLALVAYGVGSSAGAALDVRSGETYQIEMDGMAGEFGHLQIDPEFVPRSPNDSFSNRITITGNWITLTNSSAGARLDPANPAYSGTDYNPAALRTLWWSWTAPATGYLTISSPSGHYLDVLTGSVITNLVEVANGNPDSFFVTAGTTYAIAATGFPGEVALDLVLSTLRITNPPRGSVFNEGQNLALTASYTTNDGVIAQIQYFANGTSLGVASNAPFSLVWNDIPSGGFVLTAVATTVSGRVLDSPSVSFTANTHPSLSITSPAAGAVFTAGDNILLSTSATNVATFQQIEFFANGISLGLNAVGSLSLTWSNAPAGIFALTAQETDALGFAHDSPPISIAVHYRVPVNDNFTNATVLMGTKVITNGTTLGGSTQPGEPVPSGDPYSSVWYSWTAPASGTYTVIVNANFWWEFALGIYSGAAVTNLSPVKITDSYQSQNPNQNYQDSEHVVFDAEAGTTYSIDLLSISDFTLEIEQGPANDNFTNAIELTGSNPLTNGNNLFATSEPGEPGNLGGHSVWYSWTAPLAGLAALSFNSTNSQAMVNVYAGTNLSNLVSVSYVVLNGAATVNFNTVAGATYQIALSGTGGDFSLGISLSTPPPNDDFGSRQKLSGVRPGFEGTASLSTSEPGEPGFYPWITGSSVWFSWLAPADGVVEIFCTPRPIGVFTGNVVSNLTAVIPVGFGNVTFPAVAGTEYEIAIAGASWLSDDFSLSIVLPKAQFVMPTNDEAFASPASFEILARPIDLEGAVVSVGFYDGTNLLGIITNAPFQLSYGDVPAGQHTLSLVAVDENGFVSTNVPIEVRVEPGNDNFVERYGINGVATNIVADNSGATTEGGEFLPAGATGRTLWWSWTAPTNGTVTINSAGFFAVTPEIQTLKTRANPFGAGSSLGEVQPDSLIIIGPGDPGPPGPTTGPLISIYTNSALTNLSLCASNAGWYFSGEITIDPVTGLETQGGDWYVLPSFSFGVVGGQTYQISLDGVNGSFGGATIQFNFAPPPIPPPPPLPPANDNFAQRANLSGSPIAMDGTTVAASREASEPLDATNLNSRTVWYSWTAPASGEATISETDGQDQYGDPTSSLDIGVYTGLQLSNLTPVSIGPGSVSFYAHAGTTYQIDLASASGLEIGFALDLSGPPPPPSLDPQQSGMFGNGSFGIGLSGALGQSFVIQASTNLVDWETIDIDTLPGASLVFMDADSILFSQRFYRVIPFASFFDSAPFGNLAPANDAFSSRLELRGTSLQVAANNELATSEPGEWLPDGANGKTLWWSWTAPTNATVTLNTAGSMFGSPFDTDPLDGARFLNGPLISVFTGDTLTSLSLIASNSVRYSTPNYYGSSSGPMLVLTNCIFEAAAGVTYSISVDGCNGSAGPVDFAFTAALHPAFFNGEMATTNGTYYLAGTNGSIFGYYNYKSFPTLSHEDLGREYFTDANDDQHGAYFYDFTSQHTWYTTPQQFPNLFDFDLNAWIYYYPDTGRPGHYTTNPRYFFNFTTGKVFTQ